VPAFSINPAFGERSHGHTRVNIEEFIEQYYNRQWLRSAVGYRSPEEFEEQAEFASEMIFHFAGLRNVDKPGVLLFSKFSVCLDCGPF
jgi:hypothetical protein